MRNSSRQALAAATVVVAAFLIAAAASSCSDSPDASRTAATVERVVDGDTIVVSGGEHVRLLQIDTPELRERECFAREARGRLAALLPVGSRVDLETDPELDATDRFGRLLRYVRLRGRLVNVELVRAGAAAPYFFRGERGRYATELVASAQSAGRERSGLWGSCRHARLDTGRSLTTGSAGS